MTAAEQALAAIEDEATRLLADLAHRREQLQAEETQLRLDLDAKRSAARRRVDKARRAFEAG